MTQIYGTVERHTSASNKITSPSESLQGNDVRWELNGGKKFHNNIAEEVIF